MHQNHMDGSLISQNKNQQRPSKRQKLDTINSSIRDSSGIDSECISKWEKIGITREIGDFYIALSNTEATAIQVRKMRRQMEEIFNDEEKVLEISARMKRDAIERLKEHLETSYVHEAREHQTAEISMAPIMSRMMTKIKELFFRTSDILKVSPTSSNYFSEPSISSKSQETEAELQIPPEKEIKIEAEDNVEDNSENQALDLHNSGLEELNIDTQRISAIVKQILLEQEKTRTKALVEQLQPLTVEISSLREAMIKLKFEAKISNVREKSDVAERVEEQSLHCGSRESERSAASNRATSQLQQPEDILMEEGRDQKAQVDDVQNINETTQRTFEESEQMEEDSTARNTEECDSEVIEVDVPSDLVDNNDSSWEPSDEDESPPSTQQSESDYEEASGGEELRPVRKLIVGNYYVIPSNPQFFEINWKDHYTFKRPRSYTCIYCSQTIANRLAMQDHIWVQHHGEYFKCPLCPSSYSISRRTSIRKHMWGTHLS
ncbi:uncharacterized protein LOC107045665 [Diachasma alloeum]|uniref:uncharacterized protein LOC107045665 n=1 Tax=Diachasma alloeum TaxID=454923 RepID=UPI0007381E49|nr:uncharacterized protein LOC107045665 [Diachasma alloeum]